VVAVVVVDGREDQGRVCDDQPKKQGFRGGQRQGQAGCNDCRVRCNGIIFAEEKEIGSRLEGVQGVRIEHCQQVLCWVGGKGGGNAWGGRVSWGRFACEQTADATATALYRMDQSILSSTPEPLRKAPQAADPCRSRRRRSANRSAVSSTKFIRSGLFWAEFTDPPTH